MMAANDALWVDRTTAVVAAACCCDSAFFGDIGTIESTQSDEVRVCLFLIS